MIKKTVLNNRHIELGAKMVEFAGWNMPVMYSSIIDEHNATRENATLFDVSHMGEFKIKGKDAKLLLEKLIPTTLDKLEKNKSMYSLFCNEKGGVVDDLFIFMISDEEYYLVVNAGTKDKDFDWINFHNNYNVEVEDLSSITSKIDIQGPKSMEIMKKIFPKFDFDSLKRFYFAYDSFNGLEIMISNTGYTGEIGYELYIHNNQALNLWNKLLEVGKDFNLKVAGLGARDTLRLEACYSLYGHEIKEDIFPVEAGLKWLISSSKDYIGKDAIGKNLNNENSFQLIAIELIGRGIPREGYDVVLNNEKVGYLTSGAYSPTMKKGIGLAFVKKNLIGFEDEFDIIIREKNVKAKRVKKPFLSFNKKK